MDDRSRVEELLGRPPRGEFTVVVRDVDDDPVVVRNAPLLRDGTPMPTRYYLVGATLVPAVSRLEAAGGVRRAEAEISADAISAAHQAYAQERDTGLPEDHAGPTPYGGVGGTRQGVKCLHAHLAHTLAGGDDPVGRWTMEQLVEDGVRFDQLQPPPPAPADTDPPTANHDVGGLTVRIDDADVHVSMTGGSTWTLPVGAVALLDGPLERRDPPRAEQLTNALGIVLDHFDDIITESPMALSTPSVVFTGAHAEALAKVEIGDVNVPDDYRLGRADADEVFRTLVAEPAAERLHNPGLAADDVETVIGTLCVVLAIMRRLELGHAGIRRTSWR